MLIENVKTQISIKLYDITSSTYLKSKYPSRSDSSFCNFRFDIKSETVQNNPIYIYPIVVNTTSPYLEINGIKSFLANKQSITTFKLDNVPFGSHTFIANGYVIGSDATDSISLSYTCEEIDISILSFKFTPFLRSSRSDLVQQGSLKITGLKYKSIIITNSVDLLEFGNFNYFVYLGLPTSLPIMDSKILKIYFNNISFDITIPTVYDTSIKINVGLIKQYPSNGVYEKFGLNTMPCYSIQSFSKSSDNAFFVYKGYSTYPAKLIYGYEGNYSFINTFLGRNETYSIYSQNYNQFEIIYTNSTLIGSFKINEIQSQMSIANLPQVGNSKFFEILLTVGTIYDFNSYMYIYLDGTTTQSWPFGFENGNNKYFRFRISILSSPLTLNKENTFSIIQSPSFSGIQTIIVSDLSVLPDSVISAGSAIITDYQFVHLYGFKYLITMEINTGIVNDYSLGKININEISYRYDNFVSGNKTVGKFEITVDVKYNPIKEIRVSNSAFSVTSYLEGDYFSTDPPKQIIFPKGYISVDLDSIYNISFLYNNIDVSDKQVANIMYFSLNVAKSEVNNVMVSLELKDIVSLENSLIYFSKWNSDLQMFQIEFIIPKNTLSGICPYKLSISRDLVKISADLPSSSQLYVKSTYLDAYGPIFSEFTAKDYGNNKFGWEFYIEDLINGFKNGEIIVRGDLDGSTYKFELLPSIMISGDKFRGQYRILIDLNTTFCSDQNYIITNVTLYDTQMNMALYQRFNQDTMESIKNPFINQLDSRDVLLYYKNCDGFIDTTVPIIKSFKIDKSSLDEYQTLLFEFSAMDLDSGLKYKQYPIIYAISKGLQIKECISEIVYINSTFASYKCIMVIPYGFGYTSDIVFSVYGIMNNGGYYMGYTHNQLSTFDSLNNYTIIDMKLFPKLEITHTSSITSKGGDLFIHGRDFTSNSKVKVVYINNQITSHILTPSKVYGTVLMISGIKETLHPFTIQIIDSKDSNIYTVEPIIYDYTPSTPPPTNPPQKCKDDCGGEKQGYCSDNGCICYSPWIGLTCSSKVVIIPPPTTNTSNPSTELPILREENNNGGTNTTNILFKSLISMVSLRELNFESKVEKEYKFQKWIYTEINSTNHQYFTSIEILPLSLDSPKSITNITATLSWFPNETVVNFANQNFTMLASSIKYTIEISQYNFKSQLNQLQLVISASLTASKSNDICSKSEFGETNTGDNSNYIKIQVDDHSLYGRFIKRAIIDDAIRGIDNVILDSSMNPIKSSSNLQEYIGITIPNYRTNIILDPDFSVLIDDNRANDNDDNSICSDSSGLTTPQLIGIIVASSIIFISIVSIAIFLIIKRRKHILILLMAKDIAMKIKK